MRNLTIRLLVAIITLGIGITSVWVFHAPRHFDSSPAQSPKPQSRNRSEDVLRVLMPNGIWGDASQLGRFERSEAILALKEAEVDAKGERAIGIAFLLAALGENYEVNRGKLLDALKECARKSYPQQEQCDDFVADYLMQLGRKGDAFVLQPIFSVFGKADGAFAESLGCFYSEMLETQPKQFLRALRYYPKRKQRGLCQAAGIEDGGGMDEERFRSVTKQLNAISVASHEPLATMAGNCLSGVREGYTEAVQNAKPQAVR